MIKTVFPKHGRISCNKCFPNGEQQIKIGNWRMRNNPGAWGSSEPEIIVLGFSKGATQANIYENGKFEDVPFGGKRSRENLTNILRCVGILKESENVDDKIGDSERTFAFGSLIRCSLARYDKKKSAYATSGTLINKSFSEIPELIKICANTFLADISSSVRLVLMLGTADPYIKHCKNTVKSLYPDEFEEFNIVAYGTGHILWVHLTHPSPVNGTVKSWLNSEGKSGIKMNEAKNIIRFRGLAKGKYPGTEQAKKLRNPKLNTTF
ncbi:hypothetical protein [Desulfonema magnum]|uniref:Uracil-DNA glycosylase-like domain-containing protein n=1 Tax=Desulfonema magnum TaxID=45655 RepID=A0A975BI76_9BACT|nr:hypothetical protein [Desulfonema magnum]QTA85808.1 Uncharacterized protein dnm_018230 [Desulfonema magnum]